ncbi:MAG: cysteine hydrolase family protein [Candidatus Nanohaloarchaea archaeon]|nr:cysteine hydrolase family protein [Candidatus Nanohaloarchaea archaeon]
MADTIFWNVDTQYDFMREEEPGGRLPVPGAKSIEDKLAYLTEKAADEGYTVVNTADWHNEDTDELSEDPDYVETFPEHCMAGTKGAEYVPATRPEDPYVIDWKQDDVDLDEVENSREIVLYKDQFNVFEGSPHTDEVVEELDPDRVVVYGVATNVCVDQAIQGLRDRDIEVYAVTDAMEGLPEPPVEDIVADWEDREVILGTMEELDNYLEEA